MEQPQDTNDAAGAQSRLTAMLGVTHRNEFLIYFRRSTGGFQVFCRIEREPSFSWPYIGVLRHGREMTPDGCRKFAAHYLAQRSADEPEYLFRIDESGLDDKPLNVISTP